MSAYMNATPLEARAAKCAMLRAENAVAVVIEEVCEFDGKIRFSALPREATVAQLGALVRGFSGVKADRHVTITVRGCAVAPRTTLGELHDAFRQADDGMLYVKFAAERTLGYLATADACCGTRVRVG